MVSSLQLYYMLLAREEAGEIYRSITKLQSLMLGILLLITYSFYTFFPPSEHILIFKSEKNRFPYACLYVVSFHPVIHWEGY